MTPENINLCREVIRRVLFNARPADERIDGYKSTFTLCFTGDEKKAMEEIVNAAARDMHDAEK